MICSICKERIEWYERYFTDEKTIFFGKDAYNFIEHTHRKCHNYNRKNRKKQDNSNNSDIVYA